MSSGQALKNTLKRGLRAGLRATGPFVSPGNNIPRILTYHSTGYRHYETNVTPAAFSEQIAWLTDHVPVISLEDAAAGTPGVALTFDDGYRDNLEHAAPVLLRHRCPATLFVVTGCIGGLLPFEREPETGQLLDESGVRAWAAEGLAVGGHTRTHPKLTTLDPAAQAREIAGCRSDLEAILGCSVTAFAYPYGSLLDYDATTIDAVRRAGFGVACSNRYGPAAPGSDPLQLRRIGIDSTDTLASFRDKVTGRLDLLRLQDTRWGIQARRWMNRRLHTT